MIISVVLPKHVIPDAILAMSFKMGLPPCIWRISCFFLLASDVLSQVERDTTQIGLDHSSQNTQAINDSMLPRNLENSKKPHDTKFDFLMFTQLWPISNCIDWEERDADNTCTLNSTSVTIYIRVKGEGMI